MLNLQPKHRKTYLKIRTFNQNKLLTAYNSYFMFSKHGILEYV